MTKAHLDRLFALTRGAAVLGIGLGGAVLGCDHSTGDAPVAPPTATVGPQVNATATPPENVGSAPLPTRRMPIPNAMPRRPVDLGDDAGAKPPAPIPPG